MELFKKKRVNKKRRPIVRKSKILDKKEKGQLITTEKSIESGLFPSSIVRKSKIIKKKKKGD